MKRLVLLPMLCVSVMIWAQKMPSDYFQEGAVMMEGGNPQKAIESFKYIVDHHKSNDIYPKAYYNLGYCYYENRQYDKAKVIFRDILNQGFNEKDPLNGGLMDEPYANYKHRSSRLLYQLYFDQEEYDSALHYLAVADTVHTYNHFCGNAHAQASVHTAVNYAVIYERMKDFDQAEAVLLPEVINEFANTQPIVEELEKLYEVRDDRTSLKTQLDQAIDSIYTVEEKWNDRTYTNYCLNFHGTEIEVISRGSDHDKDEAMKRAATLVRESGFYKMVESL
ncbi:tetratricopeptide repeat protein [bacterium SCSIO 12741]|nr:tetratricopeptide repeat protein [bacterium SCSIO 12741]